jgi:hypothetical protein
MRPCKLIHAVAPLAPVLIFLISNHVQLVVGVGVSEVVALIDTVSCVSLCRPWDYGLGRCVDEAGLHVRDGRVTIGRFGEVRLTSRLNTRHIGGGGQVHLNLIYDYATSHQ